VFDRKNWTSHEKWILRLLLDGETNVMESLRRQLEPPFFSRVQRRRNPGGDREPGEYHLDVVFNESLLGEFSIGESVNVDIDDLRIRDQRVEGEIEIVARIRDGVLTRIIARTAKAVSWPRYIRADDWWFVLSTEKGPWRSKRRQSLQHLSGLSDHMGSSALLDLPVAKPVEQSDAEPTREDPASAQESMADDAESRSVAEEARDVARRIAADRQSQTFNALIEELTTEVGAPGPRDLEGRRRPGWSIRTAERPVEAPPSGPSRHSETAPAAPAGPHPAGRPSAEVRPAAPSEKEADSRPDRQGPTRRGDREAAEQASSRLGLEADELDGLETEEPIEEATAADPNDIRAALAGVDAGLAEEDASPACGGAGLSMSWVESFVAHAFDDGDGVDLAPPADREDLVALRRGSPANLPQDLVMFLTHADGARLWGVSVLSCHEILQLEEEQDEPRVIFALAAQGGSYALDLSDPDANGPVVLLSRKEGPEIVAESFRAWLDVVEQQARAGEIR
jgi:hypothetical protein